MQQIPNWTIENGKLTRDIQVKNFREALDLVNRVGDLAERQNHHPDICIHSWNHVKIELYTHSINGLSKKDYQLASEINDFLPQAGH